VNQRNSKLVEMERQLADWRQEDRICAEASITKRGTEISNSKWDDQFNFRTTESSWSNKFLWKRRRRKRIYVSSTANCMKQMHQAVPNLTN